MSDSSPLVPTEVATSVSGYTTPDTQELIPAMDGTSSTLTLMPPMIGGQRQQRVVLPRRLTHVRDSPVQYNQTLNVAVDARAISSEVTEVRRKQSEDTSKQFNNLKLRQACKYTIRNKELNKGMKKWLPTWKTKSQTLSSKRS